MGTNRLIIPWSHMPTYNTMMALLVGVALITLARTGRNLIENKKINPKGWALNFGVIGLILLITGVHMTLTWPLANTPFDNIIFGEPTTVFGMLLLALSFYFWTQASLIDETINQNEQAIKLVATQLAPWSILLYALTLMLISIFFAGVNFQFFGAPKAEPISGCFADYPWFESWGLSLMFLGVGISSFLTGRFLHRYSIKNEGISAWDKLLYIILFVTGWFFLLFGAMNYYTHIGLILNTMK